MASKLFCDGCETEITGEPERLGVAVVREYCEACAEIARDFLAKRNALHDAWQAKWMKQIEKLEKAYDIKLPT